MARWISATTCDPPRLLHVDSLEILRNMSTKAAPYSNCLKFSRTKFTGAIPTVDGLESVPGNGEFEEQ